MRHGRCPTCLKKAVIVWGPLCNEQTPEFFNVQRRACSEAYARRGVCPWCGRTTTTPARMLLARHERTTLRNERALDAS